MDRTNTASNSLLVTLVISLSIFFLSCEGALAAQARLAWNQSTDSSVIGYKVYHGEESGNYTVIEDVQTNLTCLVSWTSETQPRYFAVTAYSSTSESDFSEELTCLTIKAATTSNGTISPSGETVLVKGGSQIFAIAPAAGYAIADLAVDGVSVGALSSYTFTDVSANHTVSATFAPITYTIVATAAGSGTISPAGSTAVNMGSNQTFTITPAANYKIAAVTVDGTSIGAVSNYTFSAVTANHAISATFVPITYTITASSTSGGTISPSGANVVNQGSSKAFTITPNTNYKISDVTVDGTSVGAVTSYTFSNITADHTIAATFVPITYTITASSTSGGTISPSGANVVNQGTSKVFTITPTANYKIDDVKVDGTSVGAVTSYTFSNVTADHTIAATFSLITYTITASSTSGGTISPSGANVVNQGTSKVFTITPTANYKISDVKVDGTSVGAVASYTFSNLTADHTIAATFSLITHTITASSTSGGTISPSGANVVNQGTSKVFTITPTANYKIDDVKVDGTSVGAVTSYTFSNVTADHTIAATFSLITYTITASSTSGGTISPSGANVVNQGTSKVFTITPTANYKISDVKVDGTSVGAVASYTFSNLTADHTIAATFALITYTITASSTSGGTISPSGANVVNQGSSKAFTITPNTNYRISDVTVDGTSVGAVASYTFSNLTADHTIAATFALITYTITASSTSGGTISPSGANVVNQGTSKVFTITPTANYKISDVKVDGTSVGAVASYTFSNLTADHTIAATFALTTYTITASTTSGGTISPSGANVINQGSSKAFTITPNTNYKISDVTVDGTSVGAVTSYTFSNVTADHTIAATFALITYTITASSTSGGTISPSGANVVNQGTSKVFTITPTANYKIDDVKVDGTSVGAVTSYTFSNVTADHTIAATFSLITHTITASSTSGGTISPSGANVVNQGSSKAFTITPNTNYKISDVKVDGTSVGAVTSYTFSNVTADHTIAATFSLITHTITASSTSGGTISPSGANVVNQGTSKVFTITPTANYKIDDVKVDGTSVGAVTSYTFNTIAENHTIQAVFVSLLQAPSADAGPDQVLKSGGMATLNGANSTALSEIASYKWVQTGGPAVVLSNSASPTCTFTAPSTSTGISLTFRLEVTASTGITANDTCILNVSGDDMPPTADAGSNQIVTPYTIVTLDGSSSVDTDDGIATYQWIQTAGPGVAITDAKSAVTSFVAPDSGTDGVTLGFQLVVTDHYGLRMTDHCLVNVVSANQPPTADAGQDKTVYDATSTVLDGSGSSSYESSGIISYRWKQLSGLPVTFSDPAAPKTTFTAPDLLSGTQPLVFMLTVTDESGLSSSSKSVVTVKSVPGRDLTGKWYLISYNDGVLSGSLSIQNVGNKGISGNFQVAFYLSDDGKTATENIGSMYLGSIAAGGSIKLLPNFWVLNGRGKYVIAVVDSTNRVAESRENNNKVVCFIN
ncbi:MAG: CARDB domain-containing protein [Syntrophobacteraceae bacterium]